jgi:hypothetical protein
VILHLRELSTISAQNGQESLPLSTFSAVRLPVVFKELSSHFLGYPAFFFIGNVVLGSELPCNLVFGIPPHPQAVEGQEEEKEDDQFYYYGAT